MAVTVSCKNYSLINACEAEGDWTGGNPSDTIDFFKEGTQCIGFELWQAGNLDISISGTWDLSGIKHFRFWFMLTTLNELNTDALGGVQVYVSDGVNTGYYKVSGSTTYSGGWYNAVIDLSRAVDSGIKPNMAAITTIGLRFNLTGAAKKVQSLWIDHLYVGDGLVAYGDDAGSDFDLDDILAIDENVSNGWGIIRKIGGVWYIVGSLEFGDSAGVNDSKFKDESEIAIFEDRPVNSALYEILVVHNATGTGNFQLGDVSGGLGIKGCVFKSEGTVKYKFTATDTDIDILKVYGTTFLDAGTISFPPASASREVISCNFEACGLIDPDTIKFEYNNIVNADARGLRIDTASHGVKNCNFIANPHGIWFPVSVILALDACKFYGSNGTSLWDAEHSVASALTINATNLTNIAEAYIEETGGGSTTVNNAVWLRVYVKDKNGNNIQTAQCAIYKVSDDTQLMNEDTLANGLAEESFSYPGSEVAIYFRIRKSSSGDTKYIPVSGTGTIKSTGFEVTITLLIDPNA